MTRLWTSFVFISVCPSEDTNWLVLPRKTRERWPLLTIDNLCEWVLERVQMKGVLSWLVRWACHAGTRDFCLALAALVGPVHIFFLLTATLFQFIYPRSPPNWRVACLSLCVSGRAVCLHRSNNFLTLGSKTLRKTKLRDYIFYPSSLFQFFVISAVNELCMYTHVL